MKAEPVREYVLSTHALSEMARRGLSEDVLRGVLSGPEQRLEVRPGRVVLQSRMPFGVPSRTFLIRVFVDIDRRPAEVVTAYRTSKVSKYWEERS